MKRLLIILGLALAVPAAANNSRGNGWPELYRGALGRPLHRATVVATAATPKDNTTTSGGASVTYTFGGGEFVCMQGDVAFYYEVIAAASMTASGAKAKKVEANAWECVLLLGSDTKISIDAVAGTATVKMFETI